MTLRVPLHFPVTGTDDLYTAAKRYELWTHNLRANPKGFRQEPGTGSNRRRPHNKRRHGHIVEGPVHMILNGLAMFGMHAPR